MVETSLTKLLIPFLRNRRAMGRTEGTAVQYQVAVTHLSTFLDREFHDDSITNVDRRVIEDFLIDHMAHGRTSGTAHKTFATLRAYFNWLYEEEFIELNPFAPNTKGRKLKPPTPHRRPRTGYSLPEVRAMFAQLEQEILIGDRPGYLAVRDHAILMTLYDTGLRAAELCSMTVEGTKLETGMFEIPVKGGRIRLVHIAEPTIKSIQRYLDAAAQRFTPTGKLWRGYGAVPLTKSGLFQLCDKRAQSVGIQRGGVHLWRYTHSEVLQDIGWPEESIMAEMGHSVLTVSRSYREAAIRRQALKLHQEQGPTTIL